MSISNLPVELGLWPRFITSPKAVRFLQPSDSIECGASDNIEYQVYSYFSSMVLQ